TTRTSLSVSAGGSYAPFFQYVPFLKQTVAEDSPASHDQGFTAQADKGGSIDASIGLRNQFSKRASISGSVSWGDRRVVGSDSGLNSNMNQKGGQVRFSHNVSRKLAFYVGYSLQQTTYTDTNQSFVSHGLDVGLGYGDGITFQLGRKTTLSMGAGVSVAKNGEPRPVLSGPKE